MEPRIGVYMQNDVVIKSITSGYKKVKTIRITLESKVKRK